MIAELTKYRKYRFRFALESLLFSLNFEEDMDAIFALLDGLSNAKEALIKSIIERVLGVTYLSEISS